MKQLMPSACYVRLPWRPEGGRTIAYDLCHLLGSAAGDEAAAAPAGSECALKGAG